MLGRLEMDKDQCIKAYNEMCEKIFKDAGRRVKLTTHKFRHWKYSKDSLLVKGRFDHAILEDCIAKTIDGYNPDEARGVLLNDGVERRCKVCVNTIPVMNCM